MSDTEVNDQLKNLSIAGEGAEKDEVPTFDPSLKKKKKKKNVAFADEVEIEKAPAEPTTKPETEEAELDPASMFSDLKKKKKKKKKVTEEEANDEDDDDAAEQAASKDEDIAPEKDIETDDDKAADEESWLGTDRDYTYQELLNRVFKILRQNNPELAGEKRRYTIVPPQVAREGSKKSVFANIADICRRLNRSIDHVVQFLFTELGTSGSIDGSQRLVIKGRFQQKQIEVIIRRYIVEYVTCKTCKSPETVLSKENRLFFLQCESCGSTRSVSGVKSGYQANLVKRSKRKPA
ncbi:translation initiation factor eIF-2 beta subunit [Entomophthora muscae]|uniref:Translation initiation factor eIF-2 beta subunit n=1 Tax=Entomophthora muscae TaxID=34485 RepID=A0ACC2UBB2_9FUNG|nr:translation initiation factor eIF-2 beta subunit [Entomophthora muscae]